MGERLTRNRKVWPSAHIVYVSKCPWARHLTPSPYELSKQPSADWSNKRNQPSLGREKPFPFLEITMCITHTPSPQLYLFIVSPSVTGVLHPYSLELNTSNRYSDTRRLVFANYFFPAVLPILSKHHAITKIMPLSHHERRVWLQWNLARTFWLCQGRNFILHFYN